MRRPARRLRPEEREPFEQGSCEEARGRLRARSGVLDGLAGVVVAPVGGMD